MTTTREPAKPKSAGPTSPQPSRTHTHAPTTNRTPEATAQPTPHIHPVVDLHQRHGNQAIQRLVRDNPSPDPPGSEDPPGAHATISGLLRSAGHGHPLPRRIRTAMADRFDHDFRRVRIHTTPAAATAATHLNARAFTHGTDIFFAPGQYQPTTHRGHRLLTHELTHVVQHTNTNTPSAGTAQANRLVSHPAHPAEREAHAAAQSTATPIAVERSAADAPVHRFSVRGFAKSVGGAVGNAARSAYDAGASAVRSGARVVGETARGVARRGAEFVQQTIETVGELGRAAVDRIAPGLIDFLQNPAGRIREVLCSGLDTFIGGVFRMLPSGDLDFLGWLRSSFQTAVDGVRTVGAHLSGRLTETLGTVLGPLVTGIETYGIPLLQRLQDVIATVQGTVSSVWETIGQPVADFLSRVGGAVWEGIVGIATWVWDLTEPIRRYARRLWDWVREQFGIAWESTSDARNRVIEWAGGVWESIKTTLEPVMGPLRTIGGILAMLTPFGPIILLNQVILPTWEKIKWLWENWNTEDILIRARDTLREHVIPPVLSGIDSVTGAIGEAASWLSGLLTQLTTPLSSLMDALGMSTCLESVTRVVGGVANRLVRLADWAQTGFTGFAEHLQATLARLGDFLRPILDFLVRLVQVIANPLGIPMLIAGAFWQRIPDDLKPPIVTFLFELLVTFVKAIPASIPGVAPLGPIVKEAIIGFLVQLRDKSDQVKIEVSNRIAALLTGSFEFASGFLWGTLRGIWDGLTSPFHIIYMLVQIATGASRYLYNLIRQLLPGTPGQASEAPGEEPHEAPSLPGGEPVPPELTTPEAERELNTVVDLTANAEQEWQTNQDQAASQQNATSEGLLSMLGSVWNQVLTKANEIGGRIADSFLNFIQLPDFELGDNLGWVAGTVLFEVVLYVLTAGAWAAVTAKRTVLRAIVRLLNLGGEILGQLFRLLASIRRPVMTGLGTIGRFVKRIPGLGRVFDRVETALRTIFRRTTGAPARRAPGRPAAEAAEETGERTAREAARRPSPLAAREPPEPTRARPIRRGDGAAKLREYPQALAMARGIAGTNDRIGSPIAVVMAQLNALRRRFRWIDRFEYKPRGPSRYRLIMRASKNVFYPNYTTESVPTPRGATRTPAYTRVETPWGRRVYQKLDVDWNFRRPDGLTNREAAKGGLAPVRVNPQTGKNETLVLHHNTNEPGGSLSEVWSTTHSRRHAADRRERNAIRREARRDLRKRHRRKPTKEELDREVNRKMYSWRQDPDMATWTEVFNDERAVYWKWRTGTWQPGTSAPPPWPERPSQPLP